MDCNKMDKMDEIDVVLTIWLPADVVGERRVIG